MSKQVDFYFDVGSPASYLAWTQLPALCEAAGAALVFKPTLLGGVFQATGNASPALVAAKGRYMTLDLTRFAQRYGVAFRHNPFFPINTLLLMRGVTAVQRQSPERLQALLSALFRALWVDGLDLNQPMVVGQVLAAAGFDPAQLLAWAGGDETKAALRQVTEEAVARGVFGAPTMFVGDAMFFGQDRLDFVKAALA